MRLPQLLLESQFFSFGTLPELIRALGTNLEADELREISRLAELRLPPVTSRLAFATMLGVNPGLIWSFENRTKRHYRSFSIPKGNTVRSIDAPKIALKIAQKWLAVQFQKNFKPSAHVFGFVPERSHIDAALQHVGARWVFSVDIKDFFQTTPQFMVADGMKAFGFDARGAQLIASLTCLNGALAQGAPSSPVLSNICFREFDEHLALVAKTFQVRLTRYADDIVFSGESEVPDGLQNEVFALFEGWPWRLSENKTKLSTKSDRLKVHGLLVHGQAARLTKSYRNRLRAYKHLLDRDAIREDDRKRIIGHLNYGALVDRKLEEYRHTHGPAEEASPPISY